MSLSKLVTNAQPEILSAPGITVTCVQGKEVIAEREAIDALEAAADEIYGSATAEEEGEGDIEDMLKKELEAMTAAPARSSRFRVCKRESACGKFAKLGQLMKVVYILVLKPLDPTKLVAHIMERCEASARCSFRFVQRLTPISMVGSAKLERLGEVASKVLPAGFERPGLRVRFGGWTG